MDKSSTEVKFNYSLLTYSAFCIYRYHEDHERSRASVVKKRITCRTGVIFFVCNTKQGELKARIAREGRSAFIAFATVRLKYAKNFACCVQAKKRTKKTRKWCMSRQLPRFILLVQSTLTSEILLVNHASSAYEIANHASRYDVLSHVTRLIWSQSRITHSRPQSLRSFWSAAGIESSGSNHFRHKP